MGTTRRTADEPTSPDSHRHGLERNRTVRGGGGGLRSTVSPLTHMVRGSQDSSHHNSLADHQSSSSGGSSRRHHVPSRVAQASLLGSGREGKRTSVLRSNPSRPPMVTRPSTRVETSRAGGVGGSVLSPTPAVEHHKLLIDALEALDQSQSHSSSAENDTSRLLVQLVSSVVKHSCRMNARLQELVDAGVKSQVELQLLEGDADSAYDYRRGDSPRKDVWRRKYELIQTELSQNDRAHVQLIRSSNDQIRDLTETLICLNKLQRTTEREMEELLRRTDGGGSSRASASGGRNGTGEETWTGHGSQRRSVDANGTQRHSVDARLSISSRSISRASGHYSRSASPSKLQRHYAGISPLSRISGEEEDSPLARVSKKALGNQPTSESLSVLVRRRGAEDEDGDEDRMVQSPIVSQHSRSSTISFAQNRNSLLGGLQHRFRAKHRLS